MLTCDLILWYIFLMCTSYVVASYVTFLQGILCVVEYDINLIAVS